jgi:hypothetical protein
VKVRLKWVSNEGHFTLEAERVFCPYHLSHRSGVTEICDMALPAHALQAVQVRLKSVTNEGHFNLEAKTAFPPYLHSHCRVVTEICDAIPAHALQAVQVRLKSVSNEGHFSSQEFFVRISPRIAVGYLKYATWHSLRKRYKQGNLG